MKSVLAIVGLAALAIAAPVDPVAEEHAQLKRAISKRALSDPDILNFALTLEHLEATFYRQGLAKYDAQAFSDAGYGSNVRDAIQGVSNDENTHVSFLTSALQAAGATPVQECKYKFPYTSVKTFLAVAQILEATGVGAYIGAAPSISSKEYLTVAATILTVEARHNAFIRYINDLSPFPSPFDTPNSPTAVVTLATPFFVSCPSGSAPTLMGLPAITVSSGPAPGDVVTVTGKTTSGAKFCSFLSGLNATSSAFSGGKCKIPNDGSISDGPTYIFLTKDGNVTSAIAGPAEFDIESGTAKAATGRL